MKILLIYPNLGGPIGFNIGVAILSAVLKKETHEVKLIHLNESLGNPLELDKIKKTILEFHPELIGFSVNTNQFLKGIKIAKFIKDKINKDIPILFGGIHVTLNPEETINHDCIDIVIVGEGEKSIKELAEKIVKKEDFSNIKNLWTKEGEKIKKNQMRGFVDLKSIPFMDVSIFDYQKIIDSRNGWIDVMFSRGCPFNCTYCFNKSYKEIYSQNCGKQELKNYIRYDDHKKIINGIKNIIKNYNNIKCINFVDDDLLLNPAIIQFAKEYKKEIDFPFILNANLNSITEKKLKILKKTGCDLIRLGIESGNDKIRKNILNRHYSNQMIIDKSKLIKKYNIRSFTFNMIGLPTETKEDVIKTIRLNVECAPDVVKVSTFYPYSGTKIYNICKKLNLLVKDFDENNLTFYDSSILDFDEEFKFFLDKVQKYFDCYLNYYSPEISHHNKELINKIGNLSKNEFENKDIQQKIKEEIETISKKLAEKDIIHYAMIFHTLLLR